MVENTPDMRLAKLEAKVLMIEEFMLMLLGQRKAFAKSHSPRNLCHRAAILTAMTSKMEIMKFNVSSRGNVSEIMQDVIEDLKEGIREL